MVERANLISWAARLQVLADKILSKRNVTQTDVDYAAVLQRLAAEALVSSGRQRPTDEVWARV
ncbi:MAG: hypothetical protein QNJ30_20250 [Kiloniellales bacterium]|nr:hypothetical protein [Kiloniellales bacterium]